MTLNGVMAVTLRYFTEFGNPKHNHFRVQERKFAFTISSADQ